MSTGRRNISIKKGDDYSHVITLQTRSGSTYTPVDITGRTYSAQLKKRKSQASPDASFTCAVTSAVNGEVTLTLASTITADLVAGEYFWDLEQDAAGQINTILEGVAKVTSDVTR